MKLNRKNVTMCNCK